MNLSQVNLEKKPSASINFYKFLAVILIKTRVWQIISKHYP